MVSISGLGAPSNCWLPSVRQSVEQHGGLEAVPGTRCELDLAVEVSGTATALISMIFFDEFDASGGLQWTAPAISCTAKDSIRHSYEECHLTVRGSRSVRTL